MRILHISDTHGVLYPLRASKVDVIVHSGDIFPTFGASTSQRIATECRQQENWIEHNADRLRMWLRDAPLLYCTGNHDYTDGEARLRSAGINATCLNDYMYQFGDKTFYGLPWTKYFTGTWNKELLIPEMKDRIDRIPPVDVLVSHGPIYGVLDRNGYGERCGCTTMANSFEAWPQDAFLHGHIHESHGLCKLENMIVSNAATAQHIIEI